MGLIIRLIAVVFLVCSAMTATAGSRLQTQVKGGGVEVFWNAPEAAKPLDGVREFEIQASSNLVDWESLGFRSADFSAENHRFFVPSQHAHKFYRVIDRIQQVLPEGSGASIFGFEDIFKRELRMIGQITPQQFAQRYPPETNFLSRISWDPRTAQYWNEFNTDPAVYNVTHVWPDQRTFDFRLNSREMEIFTNYGFVVSERLGGYSFGDAFYKIFNDDLPVFISTDALLQAWHLSYQNMLREIETLTLRESLKRMLDGMAAQLLGAWQDHGAGVLRSNILDADYFLTVASSLLDATNRPSQLNQDARVAETIQWINEQRVTNPGSTGVVLFGRPRLIDFSQFQVRGHYTSSPVLSNYFRAMMWCSRTDFRIAPIRGFNPAVEELGAAVVMTKLLAQAQEKESYKHFIETIDLFVGWTDSGNFLQLDALLNSEGITSLGQVTNQAVLERITGKILDGTLGLQQIRGDIYMTEGGTNAVVLPRSITFLGQKFVPDSWAFTKVVYDSILWNEEGIPGMDVKVQRSRPSGVDVAFSVLANDQTVPLIVDRITNGGAEFRDGYFYQHNLAAVRNTIDRLPVDSWKTSIYFEWLNCLRQLSTPNTDSRFPESMRTRQFALKSLNTQLASWTQLRHDTVLYAKPSYSSSTICSYPVGFVEPNVPFWRAMGDMAIRTAERINILCQETYKTNQVAFLHRFAAIVQQLQILAEKELAQEPFSYAETAFINDLIEQRSSYAGEREFTGWYPTLFYKNQIDSHHFFHLNQGADKWDTLITDVHTDPPDGISSGAILHEAVGNVHMMMIAVDNGPDRMIYAGPVLSYYEFHENFPTRRTDGEWKTRVRQKDLPPPPEWTQDFLVPGPIDIPYYAQ